MSFSVVLLPIRFDILVFVVLSANLIVGDGDNINNKCANYKKSCNRKLHQPCCNQNYSCKLTGFENDYICTEKVPLGAHCLTDRDCDVNRHVECSQRNRCVCEPFTLQVDDSTCGLLIGDYCQDNEPCGPKNSVCIHNRCECEKSYFPQSNRICVQKILGMPCISDTSCAQVKFAKCTERKICECALNTMKINPYTCGSLINGFCLFHNDCVFINSYCIDNICKCKFQHVPSRKPLLDCIPGYLNMTCNSDQSCSDIIDNTICSENRCICKSDYRPINGTSCGLIFGEVCADNESCVTINSACIDNECQCKPQYVYQGTKCIPTHLNQVCQTNSDCSKIRNARCSADSKCICRENYEEINKTMCGEKLNSFCSVSGDCLIPNSICIWGQCECRDNYLQVLTKKCIATRLEQSCFENRDCKEIMYAKCSEDKKCVCKSNYSKLNETVCAPLLGEFCWNDNLCASDNSECIDNKCQCQTGYLQQSNHKCINKYLGETCVNDEDCTKVLHAKCSGAKKCVCRINYIASNKTTCTPLLGEFCWKTERCGPAHSICIDNECQCKANYVQQSNNRCLASNLEQYCNDDTDCKNIKYSKCSENNICICKSNYVPLGNKTCKAFINEFCDSDDDCFLFNVICTNNKCKCLPNFLPQSNKNCRFIYVNIMCKKDEDCKTAKYAKCSEYGACVCNTNYASLNDTTCAPLLNEYCENDSPCATANAICIDNKCRCRSNYISRFNEYCQACTYFIDE